MRNVEEKIRCFSTDVRSLRELSQGKIRRGKSPEKTGYLDAGIPIIKTADVTDTFINWKHCKCVSKKFYEENLESQPSFLDILITSTGVGSVGKVEIYDESDRPCLASAKISLLHPKSDDVDPYYLLAFLRSKYGRLQMENSARGATGQVELYASDIERIIVPIPSLSVQKQISDQVKSARRKWAQYSQSLSKTKRDFEQLLPITITPGVSKKSFVMNFLNMEKRLDADYYRPTEVSPNKIATSSNWKMAEISEFATILRGSTPSRSEYTEAGIKVIKTATLTGEGLENNFGFVSDKFSSKKGIVVRKNDVLIASTGEGSIGKTDIYQMNERAIVVAEISILRMLKEEFDPFYIYLYFNTKTGKAQLERAGRGATGQQHLYPRDIRRLSIPIPTEECYQKLEPIITLARESLICKSESEETIISVKDFVGRMIDAA